MVDNEKNPVIRPSVKLWQMIKRNIVSLILLLSAVILAFSPDAKSFVLRQVLNTGIFNSSIKDKGSLDRGQENVDFDFSDDNGNVQNTSTLRGKVILVNFWAPWCPPCRAEFPSIEKLYSEYKDNTDFAFISINTDVDQSMGKSYLEKEKFSFPMHHLKGQVPAEIFSGSLPTTLVFDKYGKIRFYHTGIANYSSNKFIEQIQDLINENYNK